MKNPITPTWIFAAQHCLELRGLPAYDMTMEVLAGWTLLSACRNDFVDRVQFGTELVSTIGQLWLILSDETENAELPAGYSFVRKTCESSGLTLTEIDRGEYQPDRGHLLACGALDQLLEDTPLETPQQTLVTCRLTSLLLNGESDLLEKTRATLSSSPLPCAAAGHDLVIDTAIVLGDLYLKYAAVNDPYREVVQQEIGHFKAEQERRLRMSPLSFGL